MPGALTFYERERRRLNVAISRARALCLVVGDRRTLHVRAVSIACLSRRRRLSARPRPREEFDSEWERRLYAAPQAPWARSIPAISRGLPLARSRIDPEGRKLDVEVDGRRWHTDADGNRKARRRLRDRN